MEYNKIGVVHELIKNILVEHDVMMIGVFIGENNMKEIEVKNIGHSSSDIRILHVLRTASCYLTARDKVTKKLFCKGEK